MTITPKPKRREASRREAATDEALGISPDEADKRPRGRALWVTVLRQAHPPEVALPYLIGSKGRRPYFPPLGHHAHDVPPRQGGDPLVWHPPRRRP